jgi:hypothetical protein
MALAAGAGCARQLQATIFAQAQNSSFAMDQAKTKPVRKLAY